MNTNDWVHDFFHGLAIDFWLAVAPPPNADLPLLEKVFGAPDGKAILDVACGAGRHSIPLARRGYAVTGVDQSTTCLSEAKLRADMAVEWHHGDMRDLPIASGVFFPSTDALRLAGEAGPSPRHDREVLSCPWPPCEDPSRWPRRPLDRHPIQV